MMARLDEPREEFWQTRIWLRRQEVVPEDEAEDADSDGSSEISQAAHQHRRYHPRMHWEPQTVVGNESLQDLGEHVAAFLREDRDELTCFANVAEDNKLHQRAVYVLATAKTLGEEWVRVALGYYMADRISEQQHGWWCTEPGEPKYLGTLDDAVAHFSRHTMIPERGPKWRDLFGHDEVLPLHLMRTVMRVEGTGRLNDALNRGWYLLSVEFEGYTNELGELVNREARYVIGHLGEYAR
jgi:hypothetical protein